MPRFHGAGWLTWPVIAVALLPATASGSTVSEDGATITFQAAPGDRDGFSESVTSSTVLFSQHPEFARIFAGSGCTQISMDLGDVVGCPLGGTSRIEVDLLDQNDQAGGGGHAAAEIIRGGLGDDTLFGIGNATVEGDDGADDLTSYRGPNVLDGGPDPDVFRSGVDATSAVKRGGGGDDRFLNLRGLEDVSGGPGRDTVEVGNPDDASLSLDDQPNDTVGSVSGSNIRSDVEHVIGNSGDDVVSARSGSQELEGGGGADRLDGGTGADTLAGDTGDDTIQARDGERDVVDCGSGQDRLLADAIDSVANCEAVLLDEDHDGSSTDTDCDDANPAIHPGAADVPDNGIDENCDGSQLNDPDRDRDGVQRPADCRDDRSDIHPGAVDVPQDGVDEDCSGKDADFPPIGATISATFAGAPGGYARFKSLKIVRVRAGATVRIRCTGPGCRRAKRALVIKVRRGRGSLNLTRRVRQLRLFRRTEVVVQVTQPRTIGALSRWRGRGPRRTNCLLRPGVRRPQRCHRA